MVEDEFPALRYSTQTTNKRLIQPHIFSTWGPFQSQIGIWIQFKARPSHLVFKIDENIV